MIPVRATRNITVPDCQLLWFRRDLRLADHPALLAAAAGERLLCVYIDEPEARIGGASRWWLHHSLQQLDASLHQLASRLLIFREPALPLLQRLCAEHQVQQVHWSRRYEPEQIARDREIKAQLQASGISVHSQRGNLLHEPWQICRDDGTPYRVFSAYWRRARPLIEQTLAPAPARLPPTPAGIDGLPLAALELLDGRPWQAELATHWQPGESAAQDRLQHFRGDTGYATRRELPGDAGTSRLSARLHFGELSARQLVTASTAMKGAEDREKWLAEIGWRDFARQLLYHWPQTVDTPLDERFMRFRWREDQAGLRAWQRGETGIPLVDAGMRELWHTGWMHNRVRMVVASFLCKHLLIDWRAGAEWFMDTLVDADLASNTLGWQWVAGCGADAAPYFRVFNPVTQSRKFDPKGRYLRRWLPELAALPDKQLHAPWEAKDELLQACGIRLGENYPQPIVDLAEGRKRALEHFAEIKNN